MEDVGEAALGRALDREERLVLFYQPIHEASTGKIFSAEALLRERRESGEIREAAIIHETAEANRGPALFRLDSVLLRKAWEDAGRWQHRFPVRVNVNLPPPEFEEEGAIDRLRALLTTCAIDPEMVDIEITETAPVERMGAVARVLTTIRDLGTRIWLDDFGSGFSTLTHLQRLPVDGVKIPGSFVKPLPDDPRCRAIVRGVIGIAHELGLSVIAEGVERREQLDFLLDLDCDLIQGFLFNRPMPAPEFESLLEAKPQATR
jgi:EAL domain-containing protein (putative c-di-GMP-specific phosphodiesterase class I)